MRPRDLPVLDVLLDVGADDRLFDLLLLCGPVVVVLVALVGRTPGSSALALAYVTAFVGNVLYNSFLS